MKIWSRDFTRFESILLVILGVLLVGMVYVQFVDRPVRAAIASSKAECSAIETELSVVKARADRLDKLNSEMEQIRSDGATTRMESYNNSKAEIQMLNDVLSEADQYTINFADVTRSNDQIRRQFTLTFRTSDYHSMRRIIEKLCASPYRCLIDEIRCTATSNSKESYVSANVTATFFETMVGGTPDAGLPEDSAAAERDVQALQ
ncbi:MAG: hypothetical protein IKD92_04035 [Lachnospiraceae bacterium]|nr:hypothetical protein [Lachnospiraceae bacterium]